MSKDPWHTTAVALPITADRTVGAASSAVMSRTVSRGECPDAASTHVGLVSSSPKSANGPGAVFAVFLGRQHHLEQRGVAQMRSSAHPGPRSDATHQSSQPVEQHLIQRVSGPVPFHPDDRLVAIAMAATAPSSIGSPGYRRPEAS